MKKGQMSFLVKMIITFVSLIIITMLLINFREYLIKQSYDTTCKASIELHQSGKLGDLNLINYNFKCPTKLTDSKTTGEKLKKELADKMYNCWDLWGSGDYNLFNTKSWDQEKFCVICEIINYSKPSKIPETEFVDFLNQNYKNDKTYLDQFKTVKPESYFFQPIKSNFGTIDTSKKQAIVFMFSKSGVLQSLGDYIYKNPAELVLSAGLLIIPGGKLIPFYNVVRTANVATVLGTSYFTPKEYDSGIAIIPYEQKALKKLGCNRLE